MTILSATSLPPCRVQGRAVSTNANSTTSRPQYRRSVSKTWRASPWGSADHPIKCANWPQTWKPCWKSRMTALTLNWTTSSTKDSTWQAPCWTAPPTPFWTLSITTGPSSSRCWNYLAPTSSAPTRTTQCSPPKPRSATTRATMTVSTTDATGRLTKTIGKTVWPKQTLPNSTLAFFWTSTTTLKSTWKRSRRTTLAHN